MNMPKDYAKWLRANAERRLEAERFEAGGLGSALVSTSEVDNLRAAADTIDNLSSKLSSTTKLIEEIDKHRDLLESRLSEALKARDFSEQCLHALQEKFGAQSRELVGAMDRLDAIRNVCNDRHDHNDEGWGKCSISGFCKILRIIDNEQGTQASVSPSSSAESSVPEEPEREAEAPAQDGANWEGSREALAESPLCEAPLIRAKNCNRPRGHAGAHEWAQSRVVEKPATNWKDAMREDYLATFEAMSPDEKKRFLEGNWPASE